MPRGCASPAVLLQRQSAFWVDIVGPVNQVALGFFLAIAVSAVLPSRDDYLGFATIALCLAHSIDFVIAAAIRSVL